MDINLQQIVIRPGRSDRTHDSRHTKEMES
jgi:hypothetical protein